MEWDVQWTLSEPAAKGGWVIQYITADFTGSDGTHADSWEAWRIPKGGQYVSPHGWDTGVDDRFQGPYGSSIHGDARYYDGLKLPKSFKPNSVPFAGRLPATPSTPRIPLVNATEPIISDWRN